MKALIKATIIVGIFLSITLGTNQTIFAENYMDLVEDDSRATTLYFSIKPLPTWIYEQYSDSVMVQWMGFGPSNAVTLYPAEFEGIDTNKTGLRADFKQDESYTLKNAPLSSYKKYIMKTYPLVNFTILYNNTIIDGKSAIKLTGVITDKSDLQTKKFVGWKTLMYLTQHDNYSYLFSVFGDPQSFDKYVPEFEQMVKTVKWVDDSQ